MHETCVYSFSMSTTCKQMKRVLQDRNFLFILTFSSLDSYMNVACTLYHFDIFLKKTYLVLKTEKNEMCAIGLGLVYNSRLGLKLAQC